MLRLLQVSPSQVLATFPLQIQSSYSWSCRNTVTPSDSSDMYTSTVQSGPPLLMLHSCPTLVSKSLISHLPILYLLPLPPPPSLNPGRPPAPPLPPDSLRVLQWNAGGLRARSTVLLHFLSSHPVDFICIQESHFNSSSGFLYSLLCVLIAPTPSLAFSLLMPRTLAAALSFLSGWGCLLLNFLPPLCLRLIPTLIM